MKFKEFMDLGVRTEEGVLITKYLMDMYLAKSDTARNVKNLADSKIHNSSLLGNDNIANAEIKDSDLKGSAITNSKVTKTTMFVPKNSNLDYSDLNNVTIDNRDVTENDIKYLLSKKNSYGGII